LSESPSLKFFVNTDDTNALTTSGLEFLQSNYSKEDLVRCVVIGYLPTRIISIHQTLYYVT